MKYFDFRIIQPIRILQSRDGGAEFTLAQGYVMRLGGNSNEMRALSKPLSITLVAIDRSFRLPQFH